MDISGCELCKFHYCKKSKSALSGTRLYDVTLMVNNGASSSSRTITGMVQVTNGCSLDTIPGKAVYCSGSDKHVINSNMVLPQTDSLTITAWVKPDGIQPDYAAIWMNETGDAGGFNLKMEITVLPITGPVVSGGGTAA